MQRSFMKRGSSIGAPHIVQIPTGCDGQPTFPCLCAARDLAGSLRGFYSRRTKLTTVAQSCGYPVDGQMDCLHHALVGVARPVASQQFDLYMVERIEVGKAVLD